MTTEAEAKEDIQKHMEYMRAREISHGMYFTDPYGRAADLDRLRQLQQRYNELQDAQ